MNDAHAWTYGSDELLRDIQMDANQSSGITGYLECIACRDEVPVTDHQYYAMDFNGNPLCRECWEFENRAVLTA